MLEDWTTHLPPLVKNVNPAKLFMQRFKNTARFTKTTLNAITAASVFLCNNQLCYLERC